MIWVRSTAYHVVFLLWTLLISISFLPMLTSLASRRSMQKGAVIWLEGALFLQQVLLGLSFDFQGLENIPAGGAVFAVKHQSAWDTLVFHRLVGDPAFIIKKELLSLPFLGWYFKKTGQIAIDRKDGTRALKKMIDGARNALAEGRRVILFPEGHRQPPGTTGKYHSGVAMIYAATDAPLFPVALNAGLYWPRNAFLRRKGKITLRILPAMPRGLDRRTFMEELEKRIERETRMLEAEAIAARPELGRRLVKGSQMKRDEEG